MQKITLFLASSSELKEDREQFELFIYRKCKAWFNRGMFLHLDIGEDFLDTTTMDILQNQYAQIIPDYDIFVLIVGNSVSKSVPQEFEQVFGPLSTTEKPFIFTYFKTPSSTTNQADPQTLQAFEVKLKALSHYRTEYHAIERLQEHFDHQLEKLATNKIHPTNTRYSKTGRR